MSFPLLLIAPSILFEAPSIPEYPCGQLQGDLVSAQLAWRHLERMLEAMAELRRAILSHACMYRYRRIVAKGGA